MFSYHILTICYNKLTKKYYSLFFIHYLIILHKYYEGIPRLTPLSMLSPVHMPVSPTPFIQSGGAQPSHSSPTFFGSISPLPSPIKDSLNKYHNQQPPRSVPVQHNNSGAETTFDFSQILKHLH